MTDLRELLRPRVERGAALLDSVEPCPSVFVHGSGKLAISYPCTLSAPHPGQLHEFRPRPGRMAVAEWS